MLLSLPCIAAAGPSSGRGRWHSAEELERCRVGERGPESQCSADEPGSIRSADSGDSGAWSSVLASRRKG